MTGIVTGTKRNGRDGVMIMIAETTTDGGIEAGAEVQKGIKVKDEIEVIAENGIRKKKGESL